MDGLASHQTGKTGDITAGLPPKDYVDYPYIAENTTVEQFFTIKMSSQNAEDYTIRVNRQPVSRDYVLRDGDRITITPTKIEGAAV